MPPLLFLFFFKGGLYGGRELRCDGNKGSVHLTTRVVGWLILFFLKRSHFTALIDLQLYVNPEILRFTFLCWDSEPVPPCLAEASVYSLSHLTSVEVMVFSLSVANRMWLCSSGIRPLKNSVQLGVVMHAPR